MSIILENEKREEKVYSGAKSSPGVEFRLKKNIGFTLSCITSHKVPLP
jgi:hypothetical protein